MERGDKAPLGFGSEGLTEREKMIATKLFESGAIQVLVPRPHLTVLCPAYGGERERERERERVEGFLLEHRLLDPVSRRWDGPTH